ncbi:MAG TPA: ATP-NAD kinase family protein [Clostridiaceae bacterium]|jgi:predicted polyphosphate/ATP-dependent NAD kinase|nr:ATP-NAD kinase family protein [Clostridiaceae bacterium]
MRFKLGLIVNPIAGIGGSVGLKGSDSEAIQAQAIKLGAKKRANEKTKIALQQILSIKDAIQLYSAPGEMGADLASSMGFDLEVIGHICSTTSGQDTENIAQLLKAIPVDLILFTGGDGTARDVYNAIGDTIPVIGIPAGVKMHSGVYATSPHAAGDALVNFVLNGAPLREGEVMDLDEVEYRQGNLRVQLYGYMKIPYIRYYIQNPKASSHLNEHDLSGICFDIADKILKHADEDMYYIFGAGSTIKRITDHLGWNGTLLGVDVWHRGNAVVLDAKESDLLEISRNNRCKLIITVIGGQGHILGRGNQQLSAAVIRQIGLENLVVVAAASKIFSLPDQTLYVDSGDESLNEEIRGYMKVIVGWQETLVCRVM